MSQIQHPDFISEKERTGRPKDLFLNWFSLNIGIMGLVYGGWILAYGLSFLQAIVAALLGAGSFALIGFLSLPGKKGSATTFVLSRAPFGMKGNIIPAALAWICLVGWLTIGNIPTGVFSVNAIIDASGFELTKTTQMISLVLIAVAVMALALVKQETLIKAQTYFTYIFGGLTVVVIAILVPTTDWSAIMAIPEGDWLSGVIPAACMIFAGSALSWANVASDYSCYQSKKSSNSGIFLSTTIGAALPLFIIMSLGILMSASNPDVANASDPVVALAAVMPKWMVIPYFITALGGILPPAVISLRSAKSALEATNIKISETASIIFHGSFMLLIPIYVLFINEDFSGVFMMFLGLVGIGLAAWAAIFAMDYIIIRRKFGYDADMLTNGKENNINIVNVIIWFIAVVVGFLFTDNPFFPAPFAKGMFDGNSLGVIPALITGMILAGTYATTQVKKYNQKITNKAA